MLCEAYSEDFHQCQALFHVCLCVILLTGLEKINASLAFNERSRLCF